MKLMRAVFLIFFGILSLPWSRAATADEQNGKAIYSAVCQGCHGADGEGKVFWQAPRLADQYGSYLMRQLIYFRDGIRGAEPGDEYGWVMAGMVRSLPDEQALKDVVEYVATLHARPAPRTDTIGDPERGREEYPAQCGDCHGRRGQGVVYPPTNPERNPRLAGQHDWYILRQLQNFKSKLRGAHEKDKYGLQMRAGVVELHEEKEMRDIIAYIQTFE